MPEHELFRKWYFVFIFEQSFPVLMGGSTKQHETTPAWRSSRKCMELDPNRTKLLSRKFCGKLIENTVSFLKSNHRQKVGLDNSQPDFVKSDTAPPNFKLVFNHHDVNMLKQPLTTFISNPHCLTVVYLIVAWSTSRDNSPNL